MRVMVDDNAKNIHLLGCDWGDVLLIGDLLQAESQSSDNPERRERAERLFAGLDLALESKVEATLHGGPDWKDLPWE